MKFNIRYFLARAMKKAFISAVRDSCINSTSKIGAGGTIVNSKFARYSFCGYNCTIINCDVGAFCSIANDVNIGGAEHPSHFVSTSSIFLSHKDVFKRKFASHRYLPSPKTRIGNDVWIGAGVNIKGGVEIGHGAIVGMGSVVTKDVAPYAIVGGNPAKLIRMRFDEHVVNFLVRTEWWNFSDAELTLAGAYFNDPASFMIAAES